MRVPPVIIHFERSNFWGPRMAMELPEGVIFQGISQFPGGESPEAPEARHVALREGGYLLALRGVEGPLNEGKIH